MKDEKKNVDYVDGKTLDEKLSLSLILFDCDCDACLTQYRSIDARRERQREVCTRE